MKNSILLRCLGVAVYGLAAVTIYGCGDETEGGGSAGTGSTSTGDASTSSGSGAGSTSSGSTSSGSTGSTGSTSASTGTGAGADAALIDDMEDGDSAIETSEGRLGYWYTFNDATAGATQTPAPDAFTMESLPAPRDGSTKAAHTTGTGFKTFAGIGFNFKLSGTEKTAYDASGYTGITFWAKKSPTSVAKVRMTLPDVNTDPAGKICSAGCYDHFGKDLTLTDEWTEFTIPFTGLAQIGFGDPKPAGIDPKQVYGIQFQVEAAPEFDYWIDDISFTK